MRGYAGESRTYLSRKPCTKQLDAHTSAVSDEALEALLQLCEDWQKHAFAVGFTAAVRLLTK